MSRLGLAKEAIRPEMKARLLLSGPPGAGKTKSALAIARHLAGPAGKMLVIDTEEESALTYADEFDFMHIPWREPFDPRELGRDLRDAAADGYVVAMVDSMTHFWNGKGGVLEIADNKFGGWKDARPAHRDLVQGFLRADMHMVLCVRSKMSYLVTENEKGRQKVEKVGMAPIQDGDLEYELNVTADIDLQHQITISKTRCSALADRVFDAHHQLELAEVYGEWLKGGDPVAKFEETSQLMKLLNELPDDVRPKAKQMFVEFFGRPEHLPERLLGDARAFVVGKAAEVATVESAEPTTVETDAEPEA